MRGLSVGAWVEEGLADAATCPRYDIRAPSATHSCSDISETRWSKGERYSLGASTGANVYYRLTEMFNGNNIK